MKMKKFFLFIAIAIAVWLGAIAQAQTAPGSDTIWSKVIGPPWIVNEVRFSPDGNLIFAGVTDKKPFVLHVSDGGLVSEFEGITSVWSIDLSNDGKLFAAAGNGIELFVYNTIDGTIRYTLELPENIKFDLHEQYDKGFSSLSISNDNKYIAGAFGGRNKIGEPLKTILIWDLENGIFIKEIPDDWREDVRFSPIEPIMAVSHNKFEESKGIDLYNTTDWSKIKTLKSEQKASLDMEFSKDGRFLSSISGDRSVDVWDVFEKTLSDRITDIITYGWSVNFINNNTLIFGGIDETITFGEIKIWDLKNDKEINHLKTLSPYDLSVYNNYIAVADYYNVTLMNVNNYVGISETQPTELPTQVIPNPVTNASDIKFDLTNYSLAIIKIFNETGNEIQEIYRGWLDKGEHSIPWQPNNLPNGSYFCKIQCGEIIFTIKIILER
jgi:WD40 repeat protein